MCMSFEGDPAGLFGRSQELKGQMLEQLNGRKGDQITLTLHPAAILVPGEFRIGSRWGEGMRGSKHRTSIVQINGVLQGAESAGHVVDIELESKGATYCILLEHIVKIEMKPRVLAAS